MCEDVIRTGKAVVITPDMIRRDIFSEDINKSTEDPGVLLGLPLKVGRHFIGAIVLEIFKNGVPLNQDEIKKIELFTDQIAPAIERKQTAQQIIESEKKYRSLFENIPNGVYRTMPDGRIIDANSGLLAIMGYDSMDQFLGVNSADFYIDQNDKTEFYNAFQGNGDQFSGEIRLKRKDGREIIVLDNSHATRDKDGNILYYEGSLTDITTLRQNEEEIRLRLTELELLYHSGLALTQLTQPEEIGRKIIDLMAERLSWHHTTIRMYNPEKDAYELLAFNTANTKTDMGRLAAEDHFNKMVSKPGEGLSGWVSQHGQPVICGDLSKDPRYKEVFPGIRSGIYVPLKNKSGTIGCLSVESLENNAFNKADEWLLTTLATQAASALQNARLLNDLQDVNIELKEAYDSTLQGWAKTLELRDEETKGHADRVTNLTIQLAQILGISGDPLLFIRWGSLLHDIGKMGVPDSILLKPGKLTEEEWAIMRQHPTHALNSLSGIEFLKSALDIPYSHHEKWDGTGYPQGLKEEQIPLSARIFAIVDVWDALSSDRPYRKAWPQDKIRRHIQEQSGKHFDPQVVDAFLKMKSDQKNE